MFPKQAGNAAEHGAAVIFAYRNKMDIVMGIALGSATQVALFVLPACVLLGWAMDQPMSLNFEIFEAVSLVLTIVTVTFMLIASNGQSNWLVGVILISAYLVISMGFWAHRSEDLDSLLSAKTDPGDADAAVASVTTVTALAQAAGLTDRNSIGSSSSAAP